MRIHWLFQFCTVLTLAFFSEYIQHYLVIAGFSWTVSAALHYLLLFGSTLSLSVSFIFQNRFSNTLNTFVSIFSLVMGLALLLSFQDATGFRDHQLFSMVFTSLVSVNLLMARAERNKTPLWNMKKTVWRMTAIFVAIGSSVGLSLLIKKPYMEDYERYTPNTFASGEKEVVQMMGELLGEENPILNEPRYVLTFFTPTCPHCKRVATYVEASRRGGRFLPTTAVIGGSNDRVAEFIESTGHSGPFVTTMNDSLFFSIVGGSVPKIYLLENDSIKGIWGGMTFNYRALDLLEDR